jgi:hypothetical protein
VPASATYEPIATTTLGSAQSSVTFSSISGSYTDLVLVVNTANSTGQTDIYLQFNSDSGNNYSKTQLYGTGSAAGSNRQTSYNSFTGFGYIGTTRGTAIGHIMNYSNSTTFKTVLARSNDTAGLVMANVGLWRNTAAITSILIGYGADNFIAGSTFTLYGISAA